MNAVLGWSRDEGCGQEMQFRKRKRPASKPPDYRVRTDSSHDAALLLSRLDHDFDLRTSLCPATRPPVLTLLAGLFGVFLCTSSV